MIQTCNSFEIYKELKRAIRKCLDYYAFEDNKLNKITNIKPNVNLRYLKSILYKPVGWTIYKRCQQVIDRCKSKVAGLRELDSALQVACHLYQGSSDE